MNEAVMERAVQAYLEGSDVTWTAVFDGEYDWFHCGRLDSINILRGAGYVEPDEAMIQRATDAMLEQAGFDEGKWFVDSPTPETMRKIARADVTRVLDAVGWPDE